MINDKNKCELRADKDDSTQRAHALVLFWRAAITALILASCYNHHANVLQETRKQEGESLELRLLSGKMADSGERGNYREDLFLRVERVDGWLVGWLVGSFWRGYVI